MIELALLGGDGIVVVAAFVEAALHVGMVIHVAGSSVREFDARGNAQLEVRHVLALGIGAGPDVDVRGAVAREVILAHAREIGAVDGLLQALALSPAEEVGEPEAFHGELQGPFAADFQDDALIRPGDVPVAEFGGKQIRIRVGIGLFQIQESGHPHALAEGVHGLVDVALGQGAQLGLGLGIVQEDLRIAEDGHVIVGLVHAAPLGKRLVHDELHHLVAGHGAIEVRGRYRRISQPDGAGTHRDGGEARVAAGQFLGELHGFPAGTVRETGTVGVQDAGNELAGEARGSLGGHHREGRGVVAHLEALVVLDGEDELVAVGIDIGEQGPVVVHLGQLVGTVVHEFPGGVGRQLQVLGGGAGVGRKRDHVHVRVLCRIVVLAERSFEQAEAGLQGQGRPAVHPVRAHARGEVGDREVDVLQHVAQDDFPAVTRPVQVLRVGFQLGVDPRHVAEALHHVEVEVGPEEAGQARVLGHGGRILALAHILEQGVHLAEVAPGAGTVAPAAAGVRDGAGVAAAQEGRKVQAHQLVALLLVGLLIQQIVIECIGEKLQVRLVPEVVLGSQGGLGRPLQKTVAGGQADQKSR